MAALFLWDMLRTDLVVLFAEKRLPLSIKKKTRSSMAPRRKGSINYYYCLM